MSVVNLGTHTLEILEDQSLILIENARDERMLQLDEEESYRLYITLQEHFRETTHLASTLSLEER